MLLKKFFKKKEKYVYFRKEDPKILKNPEKQVI